MRNRTNEQGTRPMQRHAWAAAQTDVPPAPRWVLFALTDRASASGLAYPLRSTIARDVGMQPDTVGRHLAVLAEERHHLIERVRLRRGGQLRGWLYRVLVPGSSPVDPGELPRIVPDGFELPAAWTEPVA